MIRTPADLRAWQARLGISQPEAARQTRTPLDTYHSYVQGKRRIPDNFALLCWYREKFGSSPLLRSVTVPFHMEQTMSNDLVPGHYWIWILGSGSEDGFWDVLKFDENAWWAAGCDFSFPASQFTSDCIIGPIQPPPPRSL